VWEPFVQEARKPELTLSIARGNVYQPTERWKALCEQAAAEPDGVRLLEIINELNRALEERATGPEIQDGHPSGCKSSTELAHSENRGRIPF